MLLAGKGFSPTHNKTFSTAQEPSPSGSFSKNQQHTTTLFPGLPKPLSLASQACSQSGAGASSASELGALKPTEASSFPRTHSEPPKVVTLAERAGKTLIPTDKLHICVCFVHSIYPDILLHCQNY